MENEAAIPPWRHLLHAKTMCEDTSKISSNFLSKMGIRHQAYYTATAVLHGPQSLGGMDVFNIETEQAVQHTKLMVLNLPRVTSLVGRMLQTSMSMGVLPEASYSIQDPLGAVWIHVRKQGSTEMEPGLYYYAGRAYDELHSARREIITLW
jgi:hypothetical protein